MDPKRFHWIWWDLIVKISWIPQDSIGFDELWLLKIWFNHIANLLPVPCDKLRAIQRASKWNKTHGHASSLAKPRWAAQSCAHSVAPTSAVQGKKNFCNSDPSWLCFYLRPPSTHTRPNKLFNTDMLDLRVQHADLKIEEDAAPIAPGTWWANSGKHGQGFGFHMGMSQNRGATTECPKPPFFN